MQVVARGPVAHRCPIVDETDIGTVELAWSGEAPELHGVARFLESFHDRRITHEALTQEIADAYPDASVTTWWSTAGLDVEVTVAREACGG